MAIGLTGKMKVVLSTETPDIEAVVHTEALFVFAAEEQNEGENVYLKLWTEGELCEYCELSHFHCRCDDINDECPHGVCGEKKWNCECEFPVMDLREID